MKRMIVAPILAAALWAGRTAATETQLWVSDSPADYAKSLAEGVVVDPDGVLRLGPRAVSSPAESLDVIWAIALLPGGSVALAGDGGRVERWTEAGGVRPWVRLPVGQVLSLAKDGDGLVAGTGPDGLIYRISAAGDTSLLAATGERYVWGLVPAGKGAWFAATGTRGRLLRVEKDKIRIALDSDESNLVSIASDGRGGVFAGGDSHGRILWARADGSVTTAFDAAEDEVRALALGADGALYAAALSASATSEEEAGERRVQPVKSAVSGGRATIYRIVPDSSAAAAWTPPHPFVFSLAGTGEDLLVATGNRAALFKLDRRGRPAQILAVPQGQITALAADAGGRVYAATSNPGSLWRIGPERAKRGELTSGPLDARRFARLGRVSWRGSPGGGRIEVSTRSGNTDPPDTTWSPWRAVPDDRPAASPAARYHQWKLELSGGEPRVDAVEAAWRERNLAPRIDEVAVAPQGIGFREGELQPHTEAVTQTLPGGQHVEYTASGSAQKTLRELPAWARGLRTLQWKASDPNGDEMRYRVDLSLEGQDSWTKLGEDLKPTSFTWDTQGRPDGRYRIRVRATDAPGNAVGEALTAEAVSEPFSVDNTAPAVTALDLKAEPGAIVVRGRAADGQSLVTRLEIELDDEDWRMLSPEGGLADAQELGFSVRLPEVAAGEHSVAVRAVDRAGNSSTRSARVRVPVRR
jgi:hypothetical protein